MSDLVLRIDKQGRFDLVVKGGDLLMGDDLETAVYISLLTWGAARPEDQAGASFRGGWWGDALSRSPMGSRLWLLQRQTLNAQTRAQAVDYAREALAWLVEDGVVGKLDVHAETHDTDTLALCVTLHRHGQTPLALRFSRFWEILAASPIKGRKEGISSPP